MTKYGYSTIGFICVIVFILFTLAIFINNNYIRIALIVIGIFILTFTLNFFRDPERTPPLRNDVVVSPADGTVLLVKEVEDTKFIKEKSWQISIFMSPFNVHVNRIPISGKIDYLKYIRGDYLIASNDKASEKNERSEIGILSNKGKIFFTQVAGFVARRIVFEIKQGDKVNAGERFGMIKFGSRVDVIVPFNWVPKVKKNELANKTVTEEAGGGMIKATANGKKEIISVQIDNEIINGGDKEMLEDLVVAAVNKALDSAGKMAEDEMAKITKGMLPPGLNIPGF